MSNRSVKWLCIVGATASIIGVAVPVLPLNRSSALAQSPPRNSAVTTGNQSPAIGSNNGNVYNNYYNPMVKEKSPDPRSHLLIGTWKGVHRQAAVNSQSIATGYTRMLESGSYSYSGEWAFKSTTNEPQVETIFLSQSAGTWKLDGNKLVMTLMDIKTQPKTLKQEGQPDIDLSKLPPFLTQSLPKVEDTIPRGSSMEYEIVELTPSTLKVRGKDLKGREVFYEAIRQ
jgi:hypothetical protein